MSLSLLLAFAISVPTVSAAPADLIPRGDTEQCAAYYLALTERAPQPKDSKISAATGLWASGLIVLLARDGMTSADINARLLALAKDAKPLDPAVRAMCEADIVKLADAAKADAPPK